MATLTAGTRYWYKVQCDLPDAVNLNNLWGQRPVYAFGTLPTAGADEDFMFTLDADPHFWNNWKADGSCGIYEVVGNGTSVPTAFRNQLRAIGMIGEARGLFHAQLGDFYMTDNGNTQTCSKSLWLDPPDGEDADEYFELWDQIAGWPTRNDAGTVSGGIQTQAVDSTVRADADFHIWKTHEQFRQVYAFAPFVFAWGNHDNPVFPANNTTGDCNRWTDDGQGSPKNINTHMGEAWRAIVRNPNDLYPNLEAECDAGGATTCDNNGYYYTFKAGLAQFWVINPFQESGGGGTSANVPFDLSGRFPEQPIHWSLGQAQYQWLAATMGPSTAKWKFIFTHHPAGGTEGSSLEGAGPVSTNCYHYGRGSALATVGRRCDIDGDTVGEGKLCEGDDSIVQGFDEAQDDRPAGWKAVYGWCPDGKKCRGIAGTSGGTHPYDVREQALAGNASYGAPAIHTLLAANLNSGGSNIIMQGHDHTTAGGCKVDATGCSEVWHISAGQIQGSIGDGEAPPPWADQGIFIQYDDFNGDTVADYQTDGSPYSTTLDVATNSIRKAGSQVRGFFKLFISNEGVKVQYIASDNFDFPALLGTELVAYNIGSEALYETDFDGTVCADLESKNDTPPTCSGTGFTGDLGGGAQLEGSQSANHTSSNASNLTVIDHQSAWSAQPFVQADFLFRPNASVAQSGTSIPLFRFHKTVSGSVARVSFRAASNLYYLQPFAADGTTAGTECASGLATSNSYMVRLSSDIAGGDLTTLKVDQCDANDFNCDGKREDTGAVVFVPEWGTGSFCSSVADGTGVDNADGFQWRMSRELQWTMDAFGVCSAPTGTFKCGDHFE